jgi:hypothetical protein
MTHDRETACGTRRAYRISKTFGLLAPMTGDHDMDSFYTTSGSSPPPERHEDTAKNNPRPEEQEGAGSLPEQLVEALAGLLAEALVNDIRQYPDLREVTPSSAAPSEDPVGAPPVKNGRHRQSERHRRTSTRSRTRRLAHAPSNQRVHPAP